MFRKARILDTDRLSLKEFIDVIERYHTPGQDKKLSERLSEDKFKLYLKQNPDLLAINREVTARRQWQNEVSALEKGEKTLEEIKELMADKPEPREISDDERKEREASETADCHVKWEQETISQHLMFIKGAEVIFQEFKEIIYELACRLREKIDPKTGKLILILRKFVEDWLLKRLNAIIRFKIPAYSIAGKEATRTWPESEKDALINEERRKLEAAREAARIRAED